MLEHLFDIFALFLIVIVVGFVLVTLTAHLPTGQAKTTANTLTNSINSAVDLSAIVILLIILFVDLILAWLKPNKLMAFVNFIGIFALGFINLTLTSGFTIISNQLVSNSYLPNFTSFMIGNDKVFIFLFVMVLAVIFNLRDDPNKVKT